MTVKMVGGSLKAKTVAPPVKKTKGSKVGEEKKAVKPKTQMVNCQLIGAEEVAKGKTVKEVVERLEKELKPEHDRFCREYIRDDNATRAYQRSYPNCSYETAMVNGCRLLSNAKIKERVENLRDARNKRLDISADKVLRRLEARASFNMTDLYTPDGSFIPLHELDPDVAIGIKSIEIDEIYVGSGDQRTAIGITRKITCLDGKASDELLGKNLNLWKEVGSKDNPLTGNITLAISQEDADL